MAAGRKLCWWGSQKFHHVVLSSKRPLGRGKLVILVVWSAVNSSVSYSFSTVSENWIWLPQGWKSSVFQQLMPVFSTLLFQPQKAYFKIQTLIYYSNEICVCTNPACQYPLYSSLHVFCIGKWIRWLNNLSIKCFLLNISYSAQVILSFTCK